MKKKHKHLEDTARRKSALARLEKQLDTGKKRNKEGTQLVDLTDKDKKRINRDIKILEERIQLYS